MYMVNKISTQTLSGEPRNYDARCLGVLKFMQGASLCPLALTRPGPFSRYVSYDFVRGAVLFFIAKYYRTLCESQTLVHLSRLQRSWALSFPYISRYRNQTAGFTPR